MKKRVRDQIALVYALGYRKAELIVGHDQGQLIATYAAIVRPDMFLRLTTVSGQGGAPPSFPFAGTERRPAYTAAELDADALAADADRERGRRRERADAGVLRDAKG